MLNYLKGRKAQELYNDLQVLQAFGEACDNSRFKFMFGVQELLYRSPEFQFQASILQRVEDRFDDLIITKEDVAYVVKERLLNIDYQILISHFNETISNDLLSRFEIINETFKEITSTNAKGQLQKKEVKDPSGKILMSDTKTYNIQGKLTQDVHFDATDKITTQTDFVYDAAGNLTRDKTLRNNVVFAETKHEYDITGKLTQKTRLNGKGQIDYYYTYEYNAQGNMTKENYFYNNQSISVRTFEYDLKGNKIKESYLDKLGTVNMYKIWEFACK
jgi:hypothetical protein